MVSGQLSAFSSQPKPTGGDHKTDYWLLTTDHCLIISGGHSAGATPDPIPNSAVKPGHADDTTWVTAWESRTPPDLISPQPRLPDRGGVVYKVFFFINLGILIKRPRLCPPLS